MSGAIALPLLAGVLHAAAVGAELDARVESRTTTGSQAGPGEVTRATASASLVAAGVAQGEALRLTLAYAPRLWTADLVTGRAPVVDHALEARLDARPPESTWRAEAVARASRSWSDPLADLSRTTAGGAQLPTSDPYRFEELHASARAETSVSERTSLSVGTAYGASRLAADAGPIGLPPQQAIGAEASLTELASERDRVVATVRAGRTFTGAAGEAAIADAGAASLAWHRNVSPTLEGWIGGGVALSSWAALPDAPRRLDVAPAGELGLQRSGEEGGATVLVSARVTTLVDRFTGEPTSAVDGSATLEWSIRQGATLAAVGFAGAGLGRQTAVGGGELRVLLGLRERLTMDAGVRARWQRDDRPVAPSFFETGAFVGLSWASRRAVEGGT
jgi:hypothetical protein